mgnify:CR=1 FL=1
MKGARRFRDYLKERLKDEKFRRGFEEEGVYAEVALQIARLRVERRMSQKRLAEILHTSQQMVSRLEDPRNASYSLKTLEKLARALVKELRVQFV